VCFPNRARREANTFLTGFHDAFLLSLNRFCSSSGNRPLDLGVPEPKTNPIARGIRSGTVKWSAW